MGDWNGNGAAVTVELDVEEIHPTENRGFRELTAIAREIVSYWGSFAERMREVDPQASAALVKGVTGARTLLEELRPLIAARGVHSGPRVETAGKMLALTRGRLRDPFLERNQALRLAVGDVEHLATLLAYLAERARIRDDDELAEFFTTWERKIRRVATPMRQAAIAQAADPDGAIEPAVNGPVGKVAHSVSYIVGTVGEWADRRAAGDEPGERDEDEPELVEEE